MKPDAIRELALDLIVNELNLHELYFPTKALFEDVSSYLLNKVHPSTIRRWYIEFELNGIRTGNHTCSIC